MGLPPDENLPEVVPDSSPQAISDVEAQYKQREFDDNDKFPVQYDDTPKIPSPGGYDQTTAAHPAAQDVSAVSAVRSPGSVPWEPVSAVEETPGGQGSAADNEKAPDERRICGIRRKIFFIALLVAFIILAVAIGGGVGGGLAAQNRSQQPQTTSTPSPTSTSPSSTTSSSSTASPTPTFLNNQTNSVVGDAFQGFTEPDYLGNVTDIYQDEGLHDLPFNVSSYVWLPNESNCCVTFCKNHTYAAGFHCGFRKQTNSSEAFPRINIWCGEDPNNTTKNNECS